MTPEQYAGVRAAIIEHGYQADISWAENILPCASAMDFALEHAFVVCNSGMRAQIARPIFERVRTALLNGTPVRSVFGHPGKAAAIESVWLNRKATYEEWHEVMEDAPLRMRLEWLGGLPWIGDITKYHLAKNLGVDCCKPDRHLVRIASESGELPDQLCARLSTITGEKVTVVDTVLWRAANLGLL